MNEKKQKALEADEKLHKLREEFNKPIDEMN
jgi:hypothetical protein